MKQAIVRCDKSAVDSGAAWGRGVCRLGFRFDRPNETNKVGLDQGWLRYGRLWRRLTAGLQPPVSSRTVDWRCPHARSLPNCHFCTADKPPAGRSLERLCQVLSIGRSSRRLARRGLSQEEGPSDDQHRSQLLQIATFSGSANVVVNCRRSCETCQTTPDAFARGGLGDVGDGGWI